MSRRSRALVWSFLLLLVGLSGWGALQRSHRSSWVAELQKLGIRATTEQAYESGSEGLAELCRSLYAGQCVRVLIDNEDDARALLAMSASSPAQLQILTFLDLSADCIGRLQDRFPMADLVALVPRELFEENGEIARPVRQVSDVGYVPSVTNI